MTHTEGPEKEARIPGHEIPGHIMDRRADRPTSLVAAAGLHRVPTGTGQKCNQR